MDVRPEGKPAPGASLKGRMFLHIPGTDVDGLGEFAVEGEPGDDLPPEAEVRPAAQPVGGGDGESIEHVVLVGIDAVCPLAGVEPLDSELYTQGDFRVERGEPGAIQTGVLIDGVAVGEWRGFRAGQVGFGGSTEGERTGGVVPLRAEGESGGGAFLSDARPEREPPLGIGDLGLDI